jgi:hypothetical protein
MLAPRSRNLLDLWEDRLRGVRVLADEDDLAEAVGADLHGRTEVVVLDQVRGGGRSTPFTT